MELGSSLHLGVVATEKGAFGSLSTKVTNFTYLLISLTGTIIWLQPEHNFSKYGQQYTQLPQKSQNSKCSHKIIPLPYQQGLEYAWLYSLWRFLKKCKCPDMTLSCIWF